MHNGIIGITKNDQARDKFCVTWSERSHISQDTRCLFNLEDDEEETTLTHYDNLPSCMQRDTDDVEKLVTQLKRFNVYRAKLTIPSGGIESEDDQGCNIPLVSLATN